MGTQVILFIALCISISISMICNDVGYILLAGLAATALIIIIKYRSRHWIYKGITPDDPMADANKYMVVGFAIFVLTSVYVAIYPRSLSIDSLFRLLGTTQQQLSDMALENQQYQQMMHGSETTPESGLNVFELFDIGFNAFLIYAGYSPILGILDQEIKFGRVVGYFKTIVGKPFELTGDFSISHHIMHRGGWLTISEHVKDSEFVATYMDDSMNQSSFHIGVDGNDIKEMVFLERMMHNKH